MSSNSIFKMAVLTALSLATSSNQTAVDAASAHALVCFGSYSPPEKESIHLYQLDLASGALNKLSAVSGLNNPSFLKIHPKGKYLYAVNEVSMFDGLKSGGVTAFALDLEHGALTRLNQQPSGDTGPCHLTVDATGKNVLVAHYGGGSTSVLPIRQDGSVGPVSSIIKHEGSSVHPRQKEPHAHAVHVGPNNRFAYVPDLGLDRVLVFRFDAKKGMISKTKFGGAKVAPAAGPRHFGFHPSGRFAYVINEISSSVTAFRLSQRRGTLTEIQTLSTLPHPVQGNSTAEVLVHPSGNFLYGSNRGHNSIAIFQIDPKNGRLTHIGNEPTRGKIPRNFGIDPTGQFLLAANQNSDNVVVFRIHPDNGKIQFTGHQITLSKPVCVRMILQE